MPISSLADNEAVLSGCYSAGLFYTMKDVSEPYEDEESESDSKSDTNSDSDTASESKFQPVEDRVNDRL